MARSNSMADFRSTEVLTVAVAIRKNMTLEEYEKRFESAEFCVTGCAENLKSDRKMGTTVFCWVGTNCVSFIYFASSCTDSMTTSAMRIIFDVVNVSIEEGIERGVDGDAFLVSVKTQYSSIYRVIDESLTKVRLVARNLQSPFKLGISVGSRDSSTNVVNRSKLGSLARLVNSWFPFQ